MAYANDMRSAVLAGSSCLALLTAAPGLAQTVSAQPANPPAADISSSSATGSNGTVADSGVNPDIIVTGIRGSLDK